MFNLSAIMTEAWRIWREDRRRYEAWQIARDPKRFSFGNALRRSWEKAKEAAAEAAKAARLAAALNGPNAEHVAQLVERIEFARYLPSHMDGVAIERAARAELACIAA